MYSYGSQDISHVVHRSTIRRSEHQRAATYCTKRPIILHNIDIKASDSAIKRFVQLRKRLQQTLFPIYKGLQLRVAFRLLAEGCRLSQRRTALDL
ncbi:hypothetical protein Plhal703r1_c58g0163731 [Plasmopara halstedii]